MSLRTSPRTSSVHHPCIAVHRACPSLPHTPCVCDTHTRGPNGPCVCHTGEWYGQARGAESASGLGKARTAGPTGRDATASFALSRRPEAA
jgi:hypothetical protein